MTEPRIDELPAEVRSKLGHYVYLYIDPTTKKPFYVGYPDGCNVQVVIVCRAGKQMRQLL